MARGYANLSSRQGNGRVAGGRAEGGVALALPPPLLLSHTSIHATLLRCPDLRFQGRRDELFIVSKVWNDAHRPEAVRASVERSIAALGCGRLDLLLMHWPVAWKPGTEELDEGVSLRDTW